LAQIFGETAQQAFMAMLIFMARVRRGKLVASNFREVVKLQTY
jgi:hypothetical protein